MRAWPMLILLALCNPSLAGRRADEAAAQAAAMTRLQAEIDALKASQAQLDATLAAQRVSLRELQSSVSTTQASLTEATASVDKLEQQVAALEATLSAPPSKKGKVDPQILEIRKELEALRAELEASEPKGPPPAPATPSVADEDAANALLADANLAVTAMNYPQAQQLLNELNERYPNTRAAKSAARLTGEVGLVGQRVGEPEVVHWFTAPAKLSDQPLTLLLFWEVWCPHCQREVPAASHWTEQYKDRGLQVIALTRITKSATPDKVSAFILEHKLPFAVGQMTDATNDLYKVSGIPAAALVRNGVVVWRGHPARLTPEIVEAQLKTQ